MSATSVEKITHEPHEPRGPVRVIPSPRKRHLLRWSLFGVIACGIVLTVLLGLVQQFLWMRELDYAGIFWTLLSVKWGMFGVALVFAFLYLWINTRFAAKRIDLSPSKVPPLRVTTVSPAGRVFAASDVLRGINVDLSPKLLMWASGVAVMFVSLIFAVGVSTQWDTYLRFGYGGSFGLTDPLNGVDLGFYLFRLPFFELLQGNLTFLTVGALAILGLFGLFGLRQFKQGQKFTIADNTARHLILLLFILAGTFAWGFYLDHYELVYSTLGVVYGAGYAAAHVTRIVFWMMFGASVLACALLALAFFRPRVKPLAIGIGVYALLYLGGVLALPPLVQAFVVRPNELSRETPYLNHYIEFTRNAYNLGGIQETAYPALTDLTPEVLSRNQDTIQNVRLWDSRPLLQTYQQTQAIRLYYQFFNVDVDRYHLSDGYHQVMLASRELASQLPSQAQTWVNEELQFTHGYGVVMNSVSKTQGGGFPQYLIENIPPESQ
ncbi:MAG: UPF0182 family protein, partial [Candidatus Sulfotelmatobacter sp.]